MTKRQKVLKAYTTHNNLKGRNARKISEVEKVDRRDLSYLVTLLEKSSVEAAVYVKQAIELDEKFKFDNGEVTGSLELAAKLVNLGHSVIGYGDEGMVVYLLECDNKVKIGVARSISSRIASLQIGNPYKITLLREYSVEGEITARRLEKELHTVFKSKNLIGEWFTLLETDVQYIDSYIKEETSAE